MLKSVFCSFFVHFIWKENILETEVNYTKFTFTTLCLNICSILFLSCVGCTNTIMFLSVVLRNMSGWPELWKENSYRLTASSLYTNIPDWTAAQTRKHPNSLLLSGGENWNTIEKLSSLKSFLHFSASKFYFWLFPCQR